MGVPNKFDRLGAITTNKLPAGYLPAEFLENIGGAYMDTRITVTPDTGVMAIVAPIHTGGFMAIGCQSAEGSNKRFFAPRYRRDSGEPGWGWGEYFDRARSELLGLKVLPSPYPVPENVWQTQKLNYKNNKLMELETDIAGYDSISLADLPYTPGATSLTLFAYNTPTGADYLSAMRIKCSEITKGLQIVFSGVPCIALNGAPCMFDKVTKQPFYNSGVEKFIVGMTIAQARQLSKLPVTEAGALTVSLPWEAQWDVGVQKALSVATTNGWTITVQYRDPEVATKNIEVDFLESTGTQGLILPIDTGSESLGFECDAQIIEIHYGATGVNVGGCYLFWGISVSGSNSTWYGGLGSTIQRNGTPDMYRHHWQGKVSATTGYIKCDDSLICQGSGQPSTVSSFGVFCTNDLRYLQSVRYFMLKLYRNENMIYNLVPCIDVQGVPCMYDRTTKQSFYNKGTGSFIVGFDTVKQALKLATLPDVTAETNAAKKSLTVSLPWEAQLVQHNAEAEAALQTAKSRGWTITVQYRDPVADSAVYNKYAACTTVADMQAVNPNYKRDLTADGEWEYPLNSIVDGSKMFGFYTAYMKRGYFYFPNMITATDFANGGSSLVEAEVYAPKATSLRYLFHDQSNLKKLSGDFSKLEQAVEFLCNTSIVDLEADFPSLVDASYFALNCNSSTVYRPQLNKASVLRILNSIPSYASGRHRLGIGIHVDNQSDDDVLAAIADAESKGWTLTVQWNGTATAQTASTFGLRRMPVYAKLGTLERPDGTTEQVLDWGHYVTNAEENGYMEFASVEEAKEYFNIGD